VIASLFEVLILGSCTPVSYRLMRILLHDSSSPIETPKASCDNLSLFRCERNLSPNEDRSACDLCKLDDILKVYGSRAYKSLRLTFHFGFSYFSDTSFKFEFFCTNYLF
jgi:hypothetical protein